MINSTVRNGSQPTRDFLPFPVRREDARAAFDAALGRELHEVIQEAKRMANEIQKSSDLWDLEHHLTQRRKEIDRKYDFRGSRLTDVLGRLLYENRLGEEDLCGLGEEKMKSIRFFHSVSQRRRSLICILSAMACSQQLQFPFRRCVL